jgi:hypothetical protein
MSPPIGGMVDECAHPFPRGDSTSAARTPFVDPARYSAAPGGHTRAGKPGPCRRRLRGAAQPGLRRGVQAGQFGAAGVRRSCAAPIAAQSIRKLTVAAACRRWSGRADLSDLTGRLHPMPPRGPQRNVGRSGVGERVKRFIQNHWLMTLIGFLVAIVSLVFTILVAMYPDWLAADPPARLGDARSTGDMTVTVTGVDCGKGLSDVPKELQDLEPREGGLGPIKGQLCFASTRIRNGTTAAQSINAMLTVLYVGENRFLIVGGDPPIPPIAFPDETVEVTYIFDIPSTASPTKVSFQWPEGDPVEVFLT